MQFTDFVIGFQWFFFLYFAGLNIGYLTLNFFSIIEIVRMRRLQVLDTMPQLFSGFEIPVSMLVPAFNEASTIAGSIRSILHIEYPEVEIVVINDGSTDGTLEVLTREFGLVLFPQALQLRLESKPVRGVYRSAIYPNLRVVDKENGGKADALNAGLNAARYPLVCALDGDSLLQRDSLAKVVRPFLEDPTVIAVGGTVRIANGCGFSGGFLESVGLPRNPLALLQIVEYLRAFLFGRLGWSPFNALLIISGAFGMFRKEAVIAAGGYRTETIGEDMELVTRLHRINREKGTPYRIVFVPDPICWTEAPEDLQTLHNQRVRWQRGLLESLWLNKGLLFAKRGGVVGWVAFPFILLFEGVGPVIEMAGLVFMAVAWALGLISPQAFVIFLLLVFALGVLLSASGLLLEEMSFHLYPSPWHVVSLMLVMLVESFGYRQLNAWWRFKGTWQWLRGSRQSWGEMRRGARLQVVGAAGGSG